uniref:Uncharacterized protein n=1 Tax=Panagrolaimus sp. ES5 TaxID=591445 RepID=A0AC34FYQ3_9BILA
MTNNNGYTNAGNGMYENNNGGGNDGMNGNYGTSNGNTNGNDFNSNNNNAGGFSSFGNSDNNEPGNNFNSMNNYVSSSNSMGVNGNSNGDFTSTINGGTQTLAQQQQNGFNSQSTNINSQQGSQTYETSNPQTFGSQATTQNQFGSSLPSQTLSQGYSNAGQSIYGNFAPVNYGTNAVGVTIPQQIQTYNGATNYLNIANNIAQQQAFNRPGVYGSQYNSIPPQTYTPDASSVNYGTSSSIYTGASPISQFTNSNPSSLAGAKFSSYGSSTHSNHASHAPKTNIYNVIAPIPTSASKTDGTSASQPPPPTTYKHGSNVYTTTYTGYDTASSPPSSSASDGAFSGTEKIGDVYSDNYGHSEVTNIYQTKPKTPIIHE